MNDDVSGLVLTVGADISPVEQALNEIPAVAQQAGAAIDAALATGLNDATAGLGNLGQALSGVGDAAGRAVPPLDDIHAAYMQQIKDLADAHEYLVQVQGAYDDNRASAGQLEAALKQLSEAQIAIGGKMQETVPHAHEATGAIGELKEGWDLLKHGIEGFIGYEVLKEFTQAALEAYATTQRWVTGMTALTGSVTTAKVELEQLKDMAIDTAVPFDSLLKITQQFTARGMEFEDVVATMRIAQDTAVATGASFETVATALERVYTTGQLSNRQIMQLGITWEQLAESMGTTVAEAQAAMKKGAETAELQLAQIEKALDRFKGAGDGAVKDLQGTWTIFKNRLSEDLDVVGEKLGGMLQWWGRIYTAMVALHVIEGPLFGDLIKKADATIASINDIKHASEQLGAGWIIAGKNVTAALEEQQASLERAKTHLKDVEAAYRSGATSQREYQDAVDAVTAAEKALDPAGFAAKVDAQKQAIKNASEALKEHQHELDQAAKSVQSFAATLDKLPQDYGQFSEQLAKSHDWLKKSNEEIATLQTKLNPLIAEWARFADDGTKAGASIAAALLAVIQHGEEMKTHLKQWQQDFGDFQKEFERLPVIAQLTTAEFRAVKDAAKEAVDPLKKLLDELPRATELLGRMAENTKAWDDAMKRIGLEGKKSLDMVHDEMVVIVQAINSGKYSSDQLDAAWEKLESDTKRAGGNLRDLLPIFASMNGLLQDQQKLWKDILEQDQKHDAGLKTIAADLAEISKIKFQEFVDQSNILVDAWNGVEKAFTTAFRSLSQGIAQSIVEGKSFSDVWHQIVKKLAEDIIMNLVEGAFREMLGGIGKLSGGMLNLGDDMKNVTQSFNQMQQAQQAATTSVNAGSVNAVSQISNVGSSALGVINTIATVVSAIASVFTAIELAHTNTLLGRIEESTRYAKRYLGEMGDGIYETLHEIRDLDKDLLAVASSSNNLLTQIGQELQRGLTVGGGAGTTGTGAQTMTGLSVADLLAMYLKAGVDPKQSITPTLTQDLISAIADPWKVAMDAILRAMSGVKNETIKFGLASAELQALVSGNMTVAAQALVAAGMTLEQAAAVIEKIAPQPTPYINVVTGTPNNLPGIRSGGTAVITPTGLPASTIPGVGQAAGNVGSGTNVVISPVINAQGAVFGSGGVQSLATTVGNIVMDNFRRAGMRF